MVELDFRLKHKSYEWEKADYPKIEAEIKANPQWNYYLIAGGNIYDSIGTEKPRDTAGCVVSSMSVITIELDCRDPWVAAITGRILPSPPGGYGARMDTTPDGPARPGLWPLRCNELPQAIPGPAGTGGGVIARKSSPTHT